MEIGEIVRFGKYDWQVLDIKNDKVLLLTKEMVGQLPYHNKPGDVTWETSNIRHYLNTDFFDTFNDDEKKQIVPVKNINTNNEWYSTNAGKKTLDNVFLLSIEEVACRYFGDSSELLYHPGKNQRYWFQRKDENNVYRRSTYKKDSWWWWLRSPGKNNRTAVYVWGNGVIGIQGNGTYHYSSQDVHPLTNDNSGGIRPAVWISTVR